MSLKRPPSPSTGAAAGGRGKSMLIAEPDRLVGIGFRCWLAGYRKGDISCWEQAWSDYTAVLGPSAARVALSELSIWVRAVRDATAREIRVLPERCPHFCRDECVAIAMVAASQHNACPALRACTFALLGTSMIDEVVQGAETFAATMREFGQILSPNSIFNVASLPHLPGAAQHAVMH
ncbi:MAG: hypothetical protein AB7K67_15005 [Hyphomicrobiaceae bacterium]